MIKPPYVSNKVNAMQDSYFILVQVLYDDIIIMAQSN